jgi:hypothetical protein
MSIIARLHIDGHSKEKEGLRVLSCNFGFSQHVDELGNKTGKVKSNLINITIKGTEDAEIVHWMFGVDTIRNGRIEYSGFTDSGARRKVFFQEALLVGYSENFNDQSDIILNLVVAPREITIAGEKFVSYWSPGSIT